MVHLCLFGLALAGGIAAAGGTLTVGSPGNPFDGDCAPFGCALQYEQVYGSSAFPGPISITGLTFFNNNFVPGSIAAANYTIALSTTPVAVNALSATLASNIGVDNHVFFTGVLGGPIGPTNQFTITGAPFTYTPAHGNLLLSITKDRGESDYSVFLDFLSNAPSGMFSRAYSFDASGIASAVEANTGLVTKFTYVSPTEVPETGTIYMVAPLVLCCLYGRYARKSTIRLSFIVFCLFPAAARSITPALARLITLLCLW